MRGSVLCYVASAALAGGMIAAHFAAHFAVGQEGDEPREVYATEGQPLIDGVVNEVSGIQEALNADPAVATRTIEVINDAGDVVISINVDGLIQNMCMSDQERGYVHKMRFTQGDMVLHEWTSDFVPGERYEYVHRPEATGVAPPATPDEPDEPGDPDPDEPAESREFDPADGSYETVEP